MAGLGDDPWLLTSTSHTWDSFENVQEHEHYIGKLVREVPLGTNVDEA